MRVLLVEDDPMIGKVVQQALRDASYAIDWVRDGQAALVTLEMAGYDLVLLDLGLPKRSGAILSRADLEHRIYGWNEEVESNAVEFLLHSLRKKLGSASIKNVRGVGWMVSKEA
jgi:two-component system, OmpR family, response regulator